MGSGANRPRHPRQVRHEDANPQGGVGHNRLGPPGWSPAHRRGVLHPRRNEGSDAHGAPGYHLADPHCERPHNRGQVGLGLRAPHPSEAKEEAGPKGCREEIRVLPGRVFLPFEFRSDCYILSSNTWIREHLKKNALVAHTAEAAVREACDNWAATFNPLMHAYMGLIGCCRMGINIMAATRVILQNDRTL
jgi:hypothetical protein